MISNEKKYDVPYEECDFSKLYPSDIGWIKIYLKASLKKEFQDYCKSVDIPMHIVIEILMHKYLHDALLVEKKSDMISNEKEYDIPYREFDFSKLDSSDFDFVRVFLKAGFKKEFQDYCKSIGMPMGIFIEILINKYLYEPLFFRKK